MLGHLRKSWAQRQLADPQYAYLFDEQTDELVSFDCETTSLNVKEAEILSIGAVKIRGNRVLTSESFYVVVKPEGVMQSANVKVHGLRPRDVSQGIPVQEAIKQLLAFIGGRPLVGYYLAYDVALVNKFLKPMLGIKLPNRTIEVSSIYYDQEIKNHPNGHVDLRMASMIQTLNFPDLPRHDALNDAINVALMYLTLLARTQK
ncbi:3'-5' exonuclease [Formosimonas limnophila]|uniref:3'-5' exonuclease n=1 Tax=Formosimonas limnophila TaxID=1384487 RepID=A0A8J3CK36_9BURK|nr:3'-5' exonuclease [Formosimonas limnophila]GHA67679.1 3'-5' exonuclease [Formosimonas limnophila]